MFLKKTALLGTVALLSLPFAAYADLVTNNHTDVPSTVKLTTGLHICSGSLGDLGITKPGELHHTVPQKRVDELCVGSPGGVCKADIYMTANCTGPVVAHATIKVTAPEKGKVTIEDLGSPNYRVDQIGFSEISMSKR